MHDIVLIKSRVLLWSLLFLLPVTAFGEVRLLVDTREARVDIFNGSKLELSLKDISIGRYGATSTKRQGDGKTPLGSFRVRWIKQEDRFHYFIGLDYPDMERADRALATGLITSLQHREIKSALNKGELPPQNTMLGGYIGLHGIGKGDPETHTRFNWTRGCVALTDQQIDVLLKWINIGTLIQIR